MKKVLGKVFVVALVCVTLMSMVAMAEPETYAPGNDGTYSIGYTDGAQGNYYALLVVQGITEEGQTPVISEDTVLYIDQATADANGDVSFNGWIPKNSEPATVYLGGSNLDQPVLLGYLGANNFKVAGTVTTDSGTTHEATVTLTDAESNVFTATSVNGAYEIEVPEGTYTFKVNVKNHLSYTQNNFAVNADVSGKDVSVLGGDIDGDGTVKFSDLRTVLNEYKTSNLNADILNDGAVDFNDLRTVLNNYGAVAVVD